MDENLDMSLFGKNDDFEFNYDFEPEIDDEEKDESNDDSNQNDDTQNNNTVDDEDREEVDGEDDTNEGDDADDDSGDSSSELYSSIATVLYEQGLLPSLDIDNDKIKSADDFVNAFKKELDIQSDNKTNAYLNNLDLEKIARSKSELKDLENITDEDLTNDLERAKQIVYQDYLNQGLDKTKVERLINRLIDLGDEAVIEEAKDSITSLKEFNNRKIEEEKIAMVTRIENERLEAEKLSNQIKNSIFEKNDLIKGFKPTKAIQNNVYKAMNEVVSKAPDGTLENRFMRDRRENPIEFETKMYYFYELTKGFTDMSNLTSKGKSNAVNDLEKIIQKGSFKDSGNTGFGSNQKGSPIFGDELHF